MKDHQKPRRSIKQKKIYIIYIVGKNNNNILPAKLSRRWDDAKTNRQVRRITVMEESWVRERLKNFVFSKRGNKSLDRRQLISTELWKK